jgi:hypothetical protein
MVSAFSEATLSAPLIEIVKPEQLLAAAQEVAAIDCTMVTLEELETVQHHAIPIAQRHPVKGMRDRS